MIKNLAQKISLTLLFALIIISCGTDKIPENMAVEEIYAEGLKQFQDENWLEAKEYFDVIKLQYPASQYADDAQYFLSEINYERGEYIYAAFNYNLLRRVYPGSEYSKEALYKSALCYYELSPSYERDQEYTDKALNTFQEFQYLYPGDSLFAEASEYIEDLRLKLAQREYTTAVIYRKLNSPHSALIYYDSVINKYDDTKYYESAYFGKIEVLQIMGKIDEALGIITLYKRNFPGGDNINQVKEIEKQLQSF